MNILLYPFIVLKYYTIDGVPLVWSVAKRVISAFIGASVVFIGVGLTLKVISYAPTPVRTVVLTPLRMSAQGWARLLGFPQ